MWQLIGTLFIQLVIGVFVYGRLTERNKVHTEQISKLEDKTDKHDGEIGQVFGKLGMNR
jgi:hypothetical protein